MLNLSLPHETEETIKKIATLSGLKPEQVASVLLTISLLPRSEAASDPLYSQFRTRPDLSQDEYEELLNSFGKHTPDGASSLDGVDLRELAYGFSNCR